MKSKSTANRFLFGGDKILSEGQVYKMEDLQYANKKIGDIRHFKFRIMLINILM